MAEYQIGVEVLLAAKTKEEVQAPINMEIKAIAVPVAEVELDVEVEVVEVVKVAAAAAVVAETTLSQKVRLIK